MVSRSWIQVHYGGGRGYHDLPFSVCTRDLMAPNRLGTGGIRACSVDGNPIFVNLVAVLVPRMGPRSVVGGR